MEPNMELDLDTLVEFHKALSDKSRLRILALLRVEELCVCELVEILQTSQPAISQHLRKLKNAKLVKEQRRGQWVFYSLDGAGYPQLPAILETLPDMKHEIERLKADELKVICE
jgi:ArsR family transcriptional regulator